MTFSGKTIAGKFGFAICPLVVALLSTAALAESVSISVESDKTQMISVAAKPGTVVVGNPSIADISMNGSQVFIHGRAYGNTNIIILDTKGNQLANFDVTVKQSTTNALSLYRGPARSSFACDPVCEANLQTGDDSQFFGSIMGMQTSKSSLATGSSSGEASAPAAGQ
jgi:hypothetical protein